MKHRDIDYGQRLPEAVLDALEEFISTGATPNLKLELVNPTTVGISAGIGNDQVGLGLDGKWRYNVADVTAAHPGGAAGSYDVYAVASENNFVATGGDPPENDLTDYSFGLQVVASGGTPSGTWNANPITHYRLVGACTWSGSAITDLAPALGLGAGVPAFTPNTSIAAAILLRGTLGARPTAAAGNSSFYYFASDVNGGTLYQSDGATWTSLLSSGATSDAPKRLYQGFVPNVAGVLYTVPASKQARYETLRLYNSDAVAQSVTVYDGGAAAGNTILPATEIAAGDFIELDLSGAGAQTGATIQAVATAASKVVATLYGSEEDLGPRLYKKLAQVTLTASWAAVVASFAARTKVSHVRAVNTDTVARGVGLADGGSSTTNILQDKASASAKVAKGSVMEIQSYLAFAAAGSLYGIADAAGVVVLTVYGIEG